jgi:hypothetical protein
VNVTPNHSARTELKPGQGVVVFTDDAASGATLGYYGTVVEFDGKSVERHPARSDRWKYVVYVPFLNSNCRVRASHLIATSDSWPAESAIGPAYELQFERPPDTDSGTLSGRYRLAGSADWNEFRFSKSDASAPHFQFAMPVSIWCTRPGTLRFFVPCDETLDRDYVLRALGQICGTTEWRDVTARCLT